MLTHNTTRELEIYSNQPKRHIATKYRIKVIVISSFAGVWMSLWYMFLLCLMLLMFITSRIIDIRMNIQIWLLYRRCRSERYNFWWVTIQDIAACACKVWTLFGQACERACRYMFLLSLKLLCLLLLELLT